VLSAIAKGLCLGLIAALILGARSVDAQVTNPVSLLLQAACRTLGLAPYRENLERFASAFSFHPQTDGGGDGGSGGGGDGAGDGSGSGDSGSGASDSSGSAADSTGPSDNGDPDADPATADNGIGPEAAVPPTDPTDFTNAVDFAAQQAFDAVANPFGGVPSPVVPSGETAGLGTNPVPGGPGSPGALPPPGPGRPPGSVPPPSSVPAPPGTNVPSASRAEIHAGIVSGLSDPSQVLTGNVHLTGGIVALGPPDPTSSQIAGHWDPNVKITPDPELLNGDKIPPLVPNVIDVRIMHHEVSATIESEGTISGQP
jgi:hypothetical protein